MMEFWNHAAPIIFTICVAGILALLWVKIIDNQIDDK